LTISVPAQMLYSSAIVKELSRRPCRRSPQSGFRTHPLVPKSLPFPGQRPSVPSL